MQAGILGYTVLSPGHCGSGGYFYSSGYYGTETAPVATHRHKIKQEGVLDPSNSVGHTHNFNLFGTSEPSPGTGFFHKTK